MNLLLLQGSSDLYGSSKILLESIKVFKKNGHHPIVVLSEKGPLSFILEEMGVKVYFIRLGILRRKYQSINGICNRIWVMLKAYRSIKKLIQEKQISMVYSNTTAVLVGAFAAKSLKIKHIWHIHEIIENPKWLGRFLGILVNNYSNLVIVVSEAVKQNWLPRIPGDKISLIHNGLDYTKFLQQNPSLRTEIEADASTIIIGMIGRVHYWKGQDFFLQIAIELAKKNHTLKFVLIGDAFPGYEFLYEQLKTIQEEGNIRSLVYDLGYRTDIPELIQGFDIFVLPSLQPDPFPTVILEAMAAAKPVIATRHGGALEMVENGLTGYLIEPGNSVIAAQVIQHLVDNEVLRKEMGRAGREKVLTAYSNEIFEKKLLKILE